MTDKVKTLLGITDGEKDALISFCVDAATDEVKNFCNLEELPTELENIVVRMAVDMYRSEVYGSAERGGVSSVSRGDVRVDYGSSVGGVSGEKAFIDDYKSQLYAFRKMRR